MEASIDWQNTCLDIKSRGQYLLETEKWADCRFLVGTEPNQQILSGHKLILAMASPVFERMFYGNLPDKTDPILIPDVQPDAFRAMMEYIYCDEIKIGSFDKACELCYVAKKYLLPHVVERCTNFLWSDLSPKNACRAYEFAKLFEEPRLMQRCMQIIATKTREVLADSSFLDIELTTLLAIFDQDQLSIDTELDLFNALKQYAQERGYLPKSDECNQKEQEESQSQQNEDSQQPQQNEEQQASQQLAPKENESSMDAQIDIESFNENLNNNTCEQVEGFVENRQSGEGTSKQGQMQSYSSQHEESVDREESDESKILNQLLIKEAVKKIRFLTLTPQQFAEGPAQSPLLTQSEALSIFINISSPTTNNCSMPEGFCTNRVRRNCINRLEESSGTSSAPTVSGISSYCRRQPGTSEDPYVPMPYNFGSSGTSNNLNESYENDSMAATMETRKFYCVRTIRQQIDYRNTSVTDCALTFHTDTNILITGVQVPTQVLCGELMNSAGFSERYSEILYAHLLDAQGSRLTYTHCTSRVRYDSLLEISFDRPVFIHRSRMYKIGVVFNKVGWYPMYTCYPEITCDNVHFVFNVGPPHESVRDGLIRAIVFTHLPYASINRHKDLLLAYEDSMMNY